MDMQVANPDAADINVKVGENVRAARKALGMPRRALADETRISERYIGQLETGRANISLNMLQKIAASLNVSMGELMGLEGGAEPRLAGFISRLSAEQSAEALGLLREHFAGTVAKTGGIALVGLRGAGKSTLGRLLAAELGLDFVQLTQLVSEQSGMSTQELVELAGIEAFRRFERDALEALISEKRQVVLETGGGLVSAPDTYDLVLSNFRTVWIKAAPEQHMQRVVDQNDLRPMQGRPQAMDHLKKLLAAREGAYGRAGSVLDTSGQSVPASLRQLRSALEQA
ncbi:MAG: helix-turn-helix transcriptional regulator [Pseudomonadota bacterium]